MKTTAGEAREQLRHLPSLRKSNGREQTKAAADTGDLCSEADYDADLFVAAFMEVDDVASMLVCSSRESLAFKALVSPARSNPGRKLMRMMLCQRDPSQKRSRQTNLFLKILDPSISSTSLQMKVIINGEEEDGHENEDDGDEQSGNAGNIEEPDNTKEEMDLNDAPKREEDVATEEEDNDDDEDDDGDDDDGDDDGDGRVFKIINVVNNSIEDEIASLKLSEFSDYGPFVEAVHAEWAKLTGRTPLPELDIVKPWPNFDTLYCDADGNPIDMQVKGLRWEEFRRVASCVRMFHQLVQIYLIEDNQAKQAVGEADLRPLGSYEDLAHVLHFEWARYKGKYPSPNVVDIGSSWPGYKITLFGWEAPISTAMVWEEFKYELCIIRVKMMDGGPSEDEEKNMQTAVRMEEEGVSIYLALPFPSPSQGKQISEVGQVHVFGLASYEDLARALHEAWVRYTGGNARPNVVDVEKSWPGYRVTLYALDDSGLCKHPIDIADMDWVEFPERLDSIQVEPVAAVGSSDGTSGSVGDNKFEDHGENEDGSRNGGCGDMNNCG